MRFDMKTSFITGLFVIIPLLISAWLLVWFFQTVDGFFSPFIGGIVRFLVPGANHIPGTGILAGLVIILLVGVLARNVVGAQVFSFLEGVIDRIPGYRTIYATIKQLTWAFSPESTRSFKEVLLVEHPKAGSYALGFRMETVEREGERLAVVYVPTNHLYLGDVLFIPEAAARRLDMTVEQAIRILISGGIGSPKELSGEEMRPHRG